MFFTRKPRNDDIPKIKQAINDMDIPEFEIEEFDDTVKRPIPEKIRRPPAPQFTDDSIKFEEYVEPPTFKKESNYAPVFVKVDKYKELISSLHELKLYISGTKQIFNVIQELDTIRSDAIKIMRATIQKMEKSILELDADLLRPGTSEFASSPEGTKEVGHIETSLDELQKQLGDLRKELQELK